MAAEEVVAEDGADPLAVAGLALSRRASSYDGNVTCWKERKLPLKLALLPTFSVALGLDRPHRTSSLRKKGKGGGRLAQRQIIAQWQGSI